MESSDGSFTRELRQPISSDRKPPPRIEMLLRGFLFGESASRMPSETASDMPMRRLIAHSTPRRVASTVWGNSLAEAK